MTSVQCAVFIVLGVLMTTSSAMCEDLSLGKTGKNDASSISLDPSIPPAKDAGANRSATDVDQSITDLESTRAAVNRHSGPVVTLSVSGWVSEQVIAPTGH